MFILFRLIFFCFKNKGLGVLRVRVCIFGLIFVVINHIKIKIQSTEIIKWKHANINFLVYNNIIINYSPDLKLTTNWLEITMCTKFIIISCYAFMLQMHQYFWYHVLCRYKFIVDCNGLYHFRPSLISKIYSLKSRTFCRSLLRNSIDISTYSGWDHFILKKRKVE